MVFVKSIIDLPKQEETKLGNLVRERRISKDDTFVREGEVPKSSPLFIKASSDILLYQRQRHGIHKNFYSQGKFHFCLFRYDRPKTFIHFYRSDDR